MGRRGRLRLGSSPRRASSNPLTRSLDWAPVAPRFPSSWLQPLPHPWKPRCGCQFAAAGGAAGQRVGSPPNFSPAPDQTLPWVSPDSQGSFRTSHA